MSLVNFNDIFAYRKAYTGALHHRAFLEKSFEEFSELFFWHPDTNSRIFNGEFYASILLFQENVYFASFSVFYGIIYEVGNYTMNFFLITDYYRQSLIHVIN